MVKFINWGVNKRTIFTRATYQSVGICQNGPRLRNRRFLPGSSDPALPLTVLPIEKDRIKNYVLEKDSENENDPNFKRISEAILRILNSQLKPQGAVLFRGLNTVIKHPEDFNRITLGLGQDPFSYQGGFANRIYLDETKVLNASDDPNEITIEPHLEMSYNGNRKPDRIIFFCRRAVHDPESGKPFKDGGGEITLTDMRRVTNGLDTKGLLKRICEEGIRYWRTLPDQNIRGIDKDYTWQKTLMIDDRHEAENFCRKMNYQFEWTKKGSLKYSYVMSSVSPHPVTKESVWCNQITACNKSYFSFFWEDFEDGEEPFHVTYPDGSEIADECLSHIRAVTWHESRGHTWQEGDFLVLDNHAIAHGRIGFQEGVKRDLWVALTKQKCN